MLAWDHEQVPACAGIDVHECDRALVLVDARGGQVARGDLAEQAVRVRTSASTRRRIASSVPMTSGSGASPWTVRDEQRQPRAVLVRVNLEPAVMVAGLGAPLDAAPGVIGAGTTPRRAACAPE